MKASIVDLRYKMKDILKALNRREKVTIIYHGKERGIISPLETTSSKRVEEHPFFGMKKDDKQPVAEIMKNLRKGRYNDL